MNEKRKNLKKIPKIVLKEFYFFNLLSKKILKFSINPGTDSNGNAAATFTSN